MAIGAYSVAIFTVPLAERAKIFYITPQNPVLAQIELPFVAALLLGGFLGSLGGNYDRGPGSQIKNATT